MYHTWYCNTLTHHFILLLPYYKPIPYYYASYFIFGKIYYYTTTKITPTKDRVIIRKTNGDPLLGQFQLRKPVTSLDAEICDKENRKEEML